MVPRNNAWSFRRSFPLLLFSELFLTSLKAYIVNTSNYSWNSVFRLRGMRHCHMVNISNRAMCPRPISRACVGLWLCCRDSVPFPAEYLYHDIYVDWVFLYSWYILARNKTINNNTLNTYLKVWKEQKDINSGEKREVPYSNIHCWQVDINLSQ